MNWESIASERHVWLDQPGPSGDVVISSRVRLARNLVDVPFPARMPRSSQRAMLERIAAAAQQASTLHKSQFVDLALAKKMEREFLMERHLISPEMAYEQGERGVIIGAGQQMSLMINEEDHMRLQSFEAGLALETAWRRADQADSELATLLPFAFDAEWGFCTRCPTNAGTGLRASGLLHLPALVMNGEIERMLDGLAPLGVTARGFYGERSKALGDLFQISNATSLGSSESELIESVQRVVDSLVHYERQAREALCSPEHRIATEDVIYRAWATLRHARLISYDEAMQLLSRVRLGLQLGLPVAVTPAVLNRLLLRTQPAHVQLTRGCSLKAVDRDRFRAEIIRQSLASDS